MAFARVTYLETQNGRSAAVFFLLYKSTSPLHVVYPNVALLVAVLRILIRTLCRDTYV